MLGLGLGATTTSFNNNTSAVAKLTQDYIDRVTADGGVVEATACFQAALTALGVRTTFDYIDLLFQRWTLDGATIESTDCFTNSYFLLNTKL